MLGRGLQHVANAADVDRLEPSTIADVERGVAGHVDHGIGAAHPLGYRARVGDIADREPDREAIEPYGLRSLAAERRDLVSGRDGLPNDLGTDEASRPGDEQPHPVIRVPPHDLFKRFAPRWKLRAAGSLR